MGKRETYEAISAGVLSEDFVLYEPEPLSYGGQCHGPQGFIDLVNAIRSQDKVDVVKTEPTKADGNLSICEFVFGFTSMRAGERLEAACVGLFRFDDDGNSLRGDVYHDDPNKLAAIA